MSADLDMEIVVLESVLANATEIHQVKAGLIQAVKLLKEAERSISDEQRDAARWRWWSRWWFDDRDDMEKINSLPQNGGMAAVNAAIDAEIAKEAPK